MEQNTNQEQQTPVPKKGMSDFRKGLLWTAIPLSLIGIAGLLRISIPWITGWNWMTTLGLWIIAFFAAIVLGITGRRGLASGIFAGLGLSFVVFGVTCFVAPL
jgi:hypothetical protein